MTEAHGPVYEVTLSIDPEIVEEFDDWLDRHIRQMLELPGFVSADTFDAETDERGRQSRVVQYLLESDQALDAYLAGPAEEMRRDATLRFADRFTATRRVLRRAGDAGQESRPVEACLNCDARLEGQYCARCGQRARGRLISIWELIRDAVGDLFELDSRLWRTIIPLMFRPGQLTHDYLIGRRARFMPPFRTYLVLSVVFFLVAFFDPERELGILYEPAAETADTDNTDSSGQAKTAEEIRREVLDELAAEGIDVPDDAARGPRPEAPPAPAPEPGQEPDAGRERGLNIQVDDEGSPNFNCDLGDFEVSGPEWLTRRLTPERLKHICDRVSADSGSFLNQLLDNIPAALFVLLPLMALILKMLYPLSKRYYVEHLLFVLHFHAFLFLILTLEVLFSRMARGLALPAMVYNLSVFVVSLYVPIYLYKAMRRVYGQGRAITILKYFVLVLTYLVGLIFILLFAAFYTAFSI